MKFTVTPLFAVPLYQSNLESLDPNSLELIKNLDYERMPANNGDYTKNKFVLEMPGLEKLKQQIQFHIDYFAHEILDCDTDVKFEIQNSWVNRHGKSDFAGSHRHNNSVLSGVFYLEVEPDSGAIVFEKDKSHYNLWTETIDIGFNYEKHNDQEKLNVYNSDAWGITPKNGDIVIFPSLCYHSVQENHNDRLRYSLAFNVFPRGNFGSAIDTLRV